MYYIGIDLAWNPHNSSGVALLKENKLLEVGNFYSLESIIEFVSKYPDAYVGVDAPLIVENTVGNRAIEVEFLKDYASKKLGVYPVNRTLLLKNNTIIAGEVLKDNISQTLGENLFEVYPHATIMNCFHGSVLPYKRKKDRDTNFIRTQLQILQNYLHNVIEGDFICDVQDLKGRVLKEYEDRLDAIVCAYTLYHCQRYSCKTYEKIFKVPCVISQ